jgi:hypothetical protein
LEEKKTSHLIEIYFDAADVRGANRNHAEKAVPPAAEQRDTFVQYE